MARKKLAAAIESQGATSKLAMFTAIAKEWHSQANNARTEQLDTDHYMEVLLDSVFT
eukprot:CAMPEP_0172325552 /NCGR_PEP_ID=MMETSP1058-20130122/54362_1 /TAXON_ID=83371 /ORGANISM="Detonula confervacea, Strain CCMP 353" /LENGTH=56 /DNA_ID=CAMNT_0013042131 /DNA_START=39 /DNA_END=205 /DNA_ORIENTATION=-